MVAYPTKVESIQLALNRLEEIEAKVSSLKGKALSTAQFEEVKLIDRELKVMSTYSIYNPDLPGERIAKLRAEVWKWTRRQGQPEKPT